MRWYRRFAVFCRNRRLAPHVSKTAIRQQGINFLARDNDDHDDLACCFSVAVNMGQISPDYGLRSP